MTHYRIIYAPRAGQMRHVIQERVLWFFWLDVEGHDWIGWRDSLDKAEELRATLVRADFINRTPGVVVKP